MASLLDLTQSSSFIFTGTVVERGTSSVPAVPPGEQLVVVRLDRGLRINPTLGQLDGKLITVDARSPQTLSPGQRAVFFTNSWIHGKGIAVREIEHVDVTEEADVIKAVAALPDIHLRERLADAQLVAAGEVVTLASVEKNSSERNVALWAAATLRLTKILRGKATDSAVVYFATAHWPPWTNAPRFQLRQRGVFVMHSRSTQRTASEAALDEGSLVALDPADVQPESAMGHIEQLLSNKN
jgi:hypothetical protein